MCWVLLLPSSSAKPNAAAPTLPKHEDFGIAEIMQIASTSAHPPVHWATGNKKALTKPKSPDHKQVEPIFKVEETLLIHQEAPQPKSGTDQPK